MVIISLIDELREANEIMFAQYLAYSKEVINFSSPFFPFLAMIFILYFSLIFYIYRKPLNFINMCNCYLLEVKLVQ